MNLQAILYHHKHHRIYDYFSKRFVFCPCKYTIVADTLMVGYFYYHRLDPLSMDITAEVDSLLAFA